MSRTSKCLGGNNVNATCLIPPWTTTVSAEMAQKNDEMTISLNLGKPTPAPKPTNISEQGMETKVIKAKALYDYHPSRNGQMALSVGNIFTITRKNVSGWWDATFEGNEGLIPSNYVEILPDDFKMEETDKELHDHGELPPLPAEDKASSTTGIGTKTMKAKVLYSYLPSRNEEMGLNKGDIITITRKNPSGWWDATYEGHEGLIPSNFVEILPEDFKMEETSDGQGKLPPLPIINKASSTTDMDIKITRAKALYGYSPLRSGELELRTGCIVDIIKQNPSGWWDARLEGKEGLIPYNYVEILKANPEKDEVPPLPRVKPEDLAEEEASTKTDGTREDPQGAPPEQDTASEFPPLQPAVRAEQAEESTQPWKRTQKPSMIMRPKEEVDLLPEAIKIREQLKEGKPCKNNMNILVLGMPGVGKSTLINSFLMAINKTGRYQELAEKGSYGEGGKRDRHHITLALEKCYVFQHFKPTDEEWSFQCQPWFWDCPGLQDLEDEIASDILRLIIDGKIEDGTNMKDFRKNFKTYKKNEAMKTRAIHIVVVCHAAIDTIPDNMMENIRRACKPDEQGGRNVPIIGVVTKTDVFLERYSMTELNEVKERLAEELGLIGSEEKLFASSLYCHKVTQGLKRKHEIDRVMCDIWDKILSPEYAPEDAKNNESDEEEKRTNKQRKGFLGFFKKGGN